MHACFVCGTADKNLYPCLQCKGRVCIAVACFGWNKRCGACAIEERDGP